MSLLRCRRAVALAVILPLFFVRLARMRRQGPLTPERRALWLQDCCRRVLAAAGIQVQLKGTPPRQGLLVSNHLSYLDIVVYAAMLPCTFVSKIEVNRWPYFGAAARAAGTIFLNRASHASAMEAGAAIGGRLAGKVPVLLFPEGTSTDGSCVQRFHSTLFAPAVARNAPVTPAAIGYRLADGTAEEEVCWFGDAGFTPHFWKVLAIRKISSQVHFGQPQWFADRRTAARETQNAVQRLRIQV